MFWRMFKTYRPLEIDFSEDVEKSLTLWSRLLNKKQREIPRQDLLRSEKFLSHFIACKPLLPFPNLTLPLHRWVQDKFWQPSFLGFLSVKKKGSRLSNYDLFLWSWWEGKGRGKSYLISNYLNFPQSRSRHPLLSALTRTLTPSPLTTDLCRTLTNLTSEIHPL